MPSKIHIRIEFEKLYGFCVLHSVNKYFPMGKLNLGITIYCLE